MLPDTPAVLTHCDVVGRLIDANGDGTIDAREGSRLHPVAARPSSS
jgi:hypothetical protein